MDSSIYYCKTCNSDPFTLSQKCANFEKTIKQFHLDRGHTVILLIHNESTNDIFAKSQKYSGINQTKTYTDSALSDLIKGFFNRFKDNNFYKYVDMIDSKIIQSQTIEIDFNDLNLEIQEIFKREPKHRIHIAIYRAIAETFQTRFGSDCLEEFKQRDSIRFTIPNHDLFDFKILSKPQETRRVEVTDVDKEKTVDADKEEFKKNSSSSFDAYERKNLTPALF